MTDEFKSLDKLYDIRLTEVGEDKVFPFDIVENNGRIVRVLARHKTKVHDWEYFSCRNTVGCSVRLGDNPVWKFYAPPKEPVYEYLWWVEFKGKRRPSNNAYKTLEDAQKYYDGFETDSNKEKVLERCEWSEREITDA